MTMEILETSDNGKRKGMGKAYPTQDVTSLTNGRNHHGPSLRGRTSMTRPTAGLLQSIRASHGGRIP